MRSKYALQNMLLSVCAFFINGILSFLTRKWMLPLLGAEIVGLTAVFSDILVFLNLADMGLSSSVRAGLFESIQKKEYARIHAILLFFKRAYRICGVFFSLGTLAAAAVLLYAFHGIKVGGTQAAGYFLLTAASTGCSYFLSYRLILLTADQKWIRLKFINSFLSAAQSAVKLAVLVISGSFALYLIAGILSTLVNLWLMNLLIKRTYWNIEKAKPQMEDPYRLRITKTAVGGVFHRISDFVVYGTNSLFTALFSGLASTAVLSNYQMAVSVISGTICNAFDGMTASIGSLVAEHDGKHCLEAFRTLFFAGNAAAITGAAVFINCVQPFTAAFFGSSYLAGQNFVCLLAILFYLNAIRPAADRFKDAAGLFYEDRFVPVAEAALNAAACFFFGKRFGVSGVIAGNIFSTAAIVLWQKPYMIFKYVFHARLSRYFKDLAEYLFAGALCVFAAERICRFATANTIGFTIFIRAAVSIAVCLLGLSVLFFKTGRFRLCEKEFYLLLRQTPFMKHLLSASHEKNNG